MRMRDFKDLLDEAMTGQPLRGVFFHWYSTKGTRRVAAATYFRSGMKMGLILTMPKEN